MKNSGLLLLLAFAIGCAESATPPGESNSSTSQEQGAVVAEATETSEVSEVTLPPETATLVRFSCPTMECEFCRASVKDAVVSLPGVDKIEFDEKARTVTASVKPADFKAADAVKALEDAGFPADKVEDLSTES